MISITIKNVKGPADDPISITITKIMQDEPVNSAGSGNTTPDGSGVGTSTAQIRSERQGPADGRVYHIFYTASDAKPGSNYGTCTGQVLVSVPHDQTHPAVDQGPLYDSTVMPGTTSTTKGSSITAAGIGNINNNPVTTANIPNQAGKSPLSSTQTPQSSQFNQQPQQQQLQQQQHTQPMPSQQQQRSQIQLQQQLQPLPPLVPRTQQQPLQQQQIPQFRQQQQLLPPVANTTMPQIVASQGSIVILDGRSSYSSNHGGYITAYQWRQIPAPGVPIIQLAGANTPTPSFIAPPVAQDTLLAFNLVVLDNNGITSTKPMTVYVLVKHTSTYGLGSNMPPSLGQQPMQQQYRQRMLQNAPPP